MDVILITQPKFKHDEASTISMLFDAGLEKLHLRKPQHSLRELASFLDSLPTSMHPKVVVHRHSELLNYFNLGGYHQADGESKIKNKGSTSKSLHKLKDLQAIENSFDYCFFGPVFKSISKEGYRPNISLAEIKKVLTQLAVIKNRPKVYALGGIRRKKIRTLNEVGFDGFALLGSVWRHSDPVKAFMKFNDELKKSLSLLS